MHWLIVFFLYSTISLASEELLDALANGDVEKISYCLARGDDIEFSNRQNYTPLLLAVKYGHQKATKLLLSHNARLDCPMPYNLSIFSLGILDSKVTKEERLKIYRILLRAGADYSTQTQAVAHRLSIDPDIYVANYLRKLIVNNKIAFSTIINKTQKYWRLRSLENREYKERVERAQALKPCLLEISDYDLAQLVGFMARELKNNKIN